MHFVKYTLSEKSSPTFDQILAVPAKEEAGIEKKVPLVIDPFYSVTTQDDFTFQILLHPAEKEAVAVAKLPSLIAEEGTLVVIDHVYSVTTKDNSPISNRSFAGPVLLCFALFSLTIHVSRRL